MCKLIFLFCFCENVFLQVVCGSDGQTYNSACELRQVACRLQKDIVVQAFGTCKGKVADWT